MRFATKVLLHVDVCPVPAGADRADLQWRQERLGIRDDEGRKPQTLNNSYPRAIAEIGRQARLRIWWRKP